MSGAVSKQGAAHLLHGVDEVYERAGGAGVVQQQQNLGPPELHMGLASVEQEQVLPHLHMVSRWSHALWNRMLPSGNYIYVKDEGLFQCKGKT